MDNNRETVKYNEHFVFIDNIGEWWRNQELYETWSKITLDNMVVHTSFVSTFLGCNSG